MDGCGLRQYWFKSGKLVSFTSSLQLKCKVVSNHNCMPPQVLVCVPFQELEAGLQSV